MRWVGNHLKIVRLPSADHVGHSGFTNLGPRPDHQVRCDFADSFNEVSLIAPGAAGEDALGHGRSSPHAVVLRAPLGQVNVESPISVDGEQVWFRGGLRTRGGCLVSSERLSNN